jgi:dTDP-4-amino-4,6-dideoxygalactose transaminase
VATANAVEYCGARPVFCDSRRNDYNLDPERLEETLALLERKGIQPKVVIIAHLFGLMGDMKALERLSERYGFKVVEDAACAAGAAAFGRSAGAWGAVGCFSFHPRKIITTGEGGMCVTNEPSVAQQIASLRNHGASPSAAQLAGGGPFLMADFNVLGYNYRMSDLQGAVGLCQLQRLEDMIAERGIMAEFYDLALAELDWFTRPKISKGYDHSWQAYVGLVRLGPGRPSRDEIMARLHLSGIGSRAGTHAIHELGYYSNRYSLKAEDFPVASALYAQSLSLPLHNKMTRSDQERVVETLMTVGKSQ